MNKKELIKKIIPKPILFGYHLSLAFLANIFYGRPSKKMIVIGVTGTNGKSTTAYLLAKILEAAGQKVGLTSTAMFKVADKEWLNDKKMTMLGRFGLQKLLRQMVEAGCCYAIIETSSQGLEQFRHVGINYDVAVFTNLTPEHIEAHGGFDNYKKAKEKLFLALENSTHKEVCGRKASKAIIANVDDQHAADFLRYRADEKITFGINNDSANLRAEKIDYTNSGTEFYIGNIFFKTKLLGQFNIYNALAAVATAKSLGIDLTESAVALSKVLSVCGRMEFVDAGQKFKVLVDYAPEPEALGQAYQTIEDNQLVPAGGTIIHVLGSCGGGRDIARRPILGRLAAEHADIVIVTNEDPYDDDPQEIIDQVAAGASAVGKKIDQNLFKIIDRREAIAKAVSLAGDNDLVFLTGKGCEQAICVKNGQKIPWDERRVAEEIIKNSLKK